MISLECPYHKVPIERYTMKLHFQFVDGVRQDPLRTTLLDCGCEFLDPDIDVDEVLNELSLVDQFSGDRIITFKEAA